MNNDKSTIIDKYNIYCLEKNFRKLQKQHVHLSDWLEQEVKKGEEIETEDIRKEIIEVICPRLKMFCKTG